MKSQFLGLFFFLAVSVFAHEDEPPYKRNTPSPEQTLARLQLADGLRAELVAAEPMMRHPVCFWIDPTGKIYVCESCD